MCIRDRFCSNAGDNSVSMYERDTETGMLTLKFCLPISGEYPKDIAIFPDGQHLAAINHGGNISFFHIDYEDVYKRQGEHRHV